VNFLVEDFCSEINFLLRTLFLADTEARSLARRRSTEDSWRQKWVALFSMASLEALVLPAWSRFY
jgi:hypothetical protein